MLQIAAPEAETTLLRTYDAGVKKGELPILIPVYDKKVDTLYVAKIEKIIKGQTEND